MSKEQKTYPVEVKLTSIDYVKTFEALYPLLCTTLQKVEEKNMPIWIFLELKDIARDIGESLLKNISNEKMSELICTITEMCRESLTEQVKKSLKDDAIGQYIHFDTLHLFCDADYAVHLLFKDVALDFNELQKIDAVKKQLGFAQVPLFLVGIFAPDQVEKQWIKGLETKKRKAEISDMLTGILEKAGIYLSIQDYTFNVQIDETLRLKHELTLEQQLMLTDAVADCFKMHLVNQKHI